MNEELKIIISAEVSKMKQGLDDAKSKISNFKDEVQKASANVKDNFSKIGTSISNGLKTVGTTVAAAGTALLALGASTAEYRNEQAKLTTAFEAAGSSADVAKDTYNDLYRVMGESDTAVEAANHLAKLTTEEQALSEWTTICQGVYATFGDSLPIENLTEAANETAKTGELTGGLADALNWAGVNEDAFQESLEKCNSEAEREQLIRETLNGLYADAAATYEENNAQVLAQNEAQAKLQETMALLGEAVAPVITAFTNFANDALAVIVPYIQDLATNYGPQLQSVLEAVATALEKAFTWASQNKEILMVAGGLITGIVAAIGLYNAVAAVKAAMDAAQVASLGALIAAYLAQAAAMVVAIAPYVLIVAAIAAVIAIIVLCVKHWDEIKAKVAEVWEAMKEKISTVAENIKTKVQEMVDKVKEWFENMKEKISTVVENIKTACQEKFEAIKTAITEKVQAIKEKVSEVFNNIKNTISEKITEAKNKVSEVFNNIKSTITNVLNNVKSTVSNIFNNIKSTITEKINAAKSTITNVFNGIKTTISNAINGAKDAVSRAIDKIKSIMNFKWELPKLKLPHFTISGKFSLDPPSVPKISVSWYKLGGVFDNPRLFGYGGRIGGLGEDGAEAIVPLEKNTMWLDRIATMLNEKMGGNAPVVLEVDGKVFAETSIRTINQLTRQTGKLGLAIV